VSEVVITRDVVGHVDRNAAGDLIIRDAFDKIVARACVVCHLPIDKLNGKVHSGACARKRKTYLQRLRRGRCRR
jgi:hypothetical protein